jgi:hypothetical protein
MWELKNSIKILEDNGVHLILKDMHIIALKASERERSQHP